MNRKEKNFIAIFTDSEKGMLHIENTYTNKRDFENDLKQVGYKKIRIFTESEIKEIIEKYWSVEIPDKYIKTKYDCDVVYYIYNIFRNATTEQETAPAEETEKNTENSAEEETEETAEEPEKSTENSAEEETEETAEEPEKSTENSAEEETEETAEEPEKSTENSAFKYKINILETLKKVGYTSTRIRKEKLFAQVTLQKFRTGDTNISLQTVADICNLTGLQPWDILSFSRKATEETETEEQEATPAEETAKCTENSKEEETE